jgi:probable S-adenosylmethionine-dependent methyltransferase, YraL family
MLRQKSFDDTSATLFLVATPIGNLEEMSVRAINTLKEVDCIAAEDTRNTIKLLNHFEIKTKLMSHHEHNWKQSIPKILELLKDGKNIALVSDAGYPAISDPGYELVQAAIQEGYGVVPISGPNACLNALVASGITPQPFTFYGFLDHQDKTKKKELQALKNHQETLVFYESPYRIEKTLSIMLEIFGDRSIALCRELTKRHEEIIRGTISEIIPLCETLKGEMVLVVEGAKEIEKQDEDVDIIAEIEKRLSQGASPKDAIKDVAKTFQLKKNEVYDLYLKHKA